MAEAPISRSGSEEPREGSAREGEDGNGLRLVIPAEIVEGLKARIRGSAFPSVDAFVLFVLARLAESVSPTPFSAEDEEKLKARLRSLGYLD